jgi:recombination endonuclease VII
MANEARWAARRRQIEIDRAEGQKTCKTCKLRKPRFEYTRDRYTADGLTYACSKCRTGSARQVRVTDPLGSIRCSQCEERKNPSDFSPNRRNRSGRQSCCKLCNTKWTRARKRGLTLDQVERLDRAAEGKCQTCGEGPKGARKFLCIDHDHATGRIRGLLCNSCNRILGLVKDSPERLRAMAAYLEKK